ncbi:hypothetical protein CDV36_015184 [Fusarium kuroshium]|uniref:C2H2-type domain-containing protein n=1 Tax=Fusarium kuroshium TaxID=2010991 RepID=A0A3M2RDA2_9HYPO|nr:hypothetical protein CDV36_015184 [Fusarium kuroshium]
MPSGHQPDGTFLCKPCQIKFPTWELLCRHKDRMQSAGKAKHIHCKFCGMDFKTEIAHMTHIHQSHPQAQDLQCPGCNQGPFAKLGGLLSHIQNDCTILRVSFLEHLREEKMEFATQLQAMTNEPVKANYAHYMPAAGGGGYDYSDIDSNIEAFELKKEEFPDLYKPKSTFDHTDNKENIAPWEWDSGKTLFPDAPPAQEPTEEQLEAAAAPGPQDWDEWMNVNDPSHPKFNVARYYSPIIDKYACPVIGCGKTFKNSRSITGHLKSPAHSGTKYRCPYCLRTFNSLAAITQHAEDSSVRCRVRETDTYGALIDQLTGGMADVSVRRHDDGTVKYEVSKNFRRKEPEFSKAKPFKPEFSKPEFPKPEPLKAKEPQPSKTEPIKPKPVMTEPFKLQQVKTEPFKSQPLKTKEPEPAKRKLPKPQPLMAEVLKAGVSKPQPLNTEPSKPRVFRTEPSKPESSKPQPFNLQQARTWISQPQSPKAKEPELLKPEPPKFELPKTELSKPQVFKTEPSKSESSKPQPFSLQQAKIWISQPQSLKAKESGLSMPQPLKPQPSKSESSKSQAAKLQQIKAEIAKLQPPKAKEPVPSKTVFSKPQPLKAELLKAQQFQNGEWITEYDPWTGRQITRWSTK